MHLLCNLNQQLFTDIHMAGPHTYNVSTVYLLIFTNIDIAKISYIYYTLIYAYVSIFTLMLALLSCTTKHNPKRKPPPPPEHLWP